MTSQSTTSTTTLEERPPAGPATRPAAPQDTVDELVERLFGSALASMELATVHLGLQLGLYHALRELGGATPAELAQHLDADERYLREWLEQQAVAQLLACTDDQAPPSERRYTLPDATATVLLDPSTPAYLGPLSHFAVGTLLALPALTTVFATGEGIPFPAYGAEVRHGLGLLNGAAFDRSMADWLTALPDVDEHLRTGRDAAVLDIGCGTGRSSIAIARAYPNVLVHGIDLDATSIDEARAAAARAGLAHRVTFSLEDAAGRERGTTPRYDLVTIFEALHDLGDPIGTLAASRRHLRQGGAVLIADQLTRGSFAADGDPLERFQYGCSVLHCLPATRAEEHVTAHGTVIRAATVTEWALAAGFGAARTLDIDDAFWRFYRLDAG